MTSIMPGVGFIFSNITVPRGNCLAPEFIRKDFNGDVIRTFEEAADTTKIDIKALCLEANSPQRENIENAALIGLTLGVASFRLLEAQGLVQENDAVAGNSLGNIPALVAAKSLDFKPALSYVSSLGRAISQVAQNGNYGMLSITYLLNPSKESPLRSTPKNPKISQLLGDLPARVWLAARNTPHQVVLAGDRDELETIKDNIGRGAEMLPFRAPLHAAPIVTAEEEIEEIFESLEFSTPQRPFFTSTSGRLEADPERIRNGLQHAYSTTSHWLHTIYTMIRAEGGYSLRDFVPLGVGSESISHLDHTIRKENLHRKKTEESELVINIVNAQEEQKMKETIRFLKELGRG